MDITYLKNVRKRRNSTRRPSGGTTHTARLKENTSVENPIFILDVVDPDINYIIALGHYYYITDIVIVNNDIAEYHCKNDALATHRETILDSNQYVERCATKDYWDTEIIDDMYPVQMDPSIFQTNKSTPFCVSAGDQGTGTNASLILSIKSSNGTSFWAMRRGLFGRLGEALYQMSQDQDALWSSITSGSLYKTYLDPMQYVTDARIIPIDTLSLLTTTSSATIDIGYWSYSDPDTEVFYKILGQIIYKSPEYTLDFQSRNTEQNNFQNCNKFRQYKLTLPGVGTIELDANIVLTGNNVKVKFFVDVVGGICYEIAYGAGNVYKDYISGNISIPFAIHGQTADFSKTVGAGMNVIGGVAGGVSTGVGLGAIGGPVGMAVGGVAGGLLGGAMGAGRSLSNAGPLFHTQTVGQDGSYARLSANKDIILQETIYHPSHFGIERLGAPCMRDIKLRKLSGYVKCQNASVSLAGFDTDRAEIESYLNSGVYIE